LIGSAASLVGTTGVTSGLGYLFWLIAARRFAPADLGLAAAAVSAMLLLGSLAVMGLGTLLIRELPRTPDARAKLVSTALAAATVIGAVLGALGALAGRYVSSDLAELGAGLPSIILFSLGVSVSALTQVLDSALLGLLRGELQFARNVVFAAAKLVALILATAGSAMLVWQSMYAAWLLGGLVSLAGLAAFAYLRGQMPLTVRFDWARLRQLAPAALSHHVLNVALQASQLALPVVVTAVLSAATNAYFYTAWMIASLAFVAPVALATSLYAVGSHDPQALRAKMRLSLKLAALSAVLANVVLLVGADELLLRLYGPEFASQASTSLRILGLSAFPLVIKDHYVTLRRISGSLAYTPLLLLTAACLELLLAAAGARVGGMPGLCMGYLLALLAQAGLMIGPVCKTVLDRPKQRLVAVIKLGASS
jgi:O-antigen/teichoic acid export membrane protein